MKQLIEHGHIVRGWLGIHLRDINKEMRKYLDFKDNDEGSYVQAVLRDGPAQVTGILPGDIITKINNIKVKNANETVKIVASLKPEKSYPIEIFRKGDFLTFSVLIKQTPKSR